MENSIIAKIKKLMAHAESAEKLGSIAEAEMFAAKAQSLLNEHNLSKSDLKEEELLAEVIHDTMELKVKGIGGRSNFDVMSVIAKFNWCRVYTYGNASDNKMLIIGSPENIEVCKYIHSIVLSVFMKVGKQKYKEYQDSNFGRTVGFDTFMRTFLKGCGDGLRIKFEAENVKFEEENENSTAVMRTNAVALTDYVDKTWGGSGKARQAKYSNAGGAYQSGKEVGKNVTINKAVTGQSKPISRKMLN